MKTYIWIIVTAKTAIRCNSADDKLLQILKE